MQPSRFPFGLFLSIALFGGMAEVHASSPTDSIAVAAFPDDTADQPYTNTIVSPEDTLPVWSFEFSFTGSRSPDSSLQRNWTNQVTRTWHRGDWEPSVVAGWSRSDQGRADSTLWHLGTGLDWSFTELLTFGAALDWTPVLGQKDDASGHLGLSGSDVIGDLLGVDAAISGTWDRIDRGNIEVAFGISPDFGWTDGRIGATLDRQYQSYLDASGSARSEYLNVWGWSAQWAFHRGKWSTGPTWSGDYWKANASASMVTAKGKAARLIGKTRKLPASGKAIDQEFLWNLTWKPLAGIAISLDAFRTTGGETIKAKASATPVQKTTFATWNQATVLPQDATGGRATISISW